VPLFSGFYEPTSTLAISEVPIGYLPMRRSECRPDLGSPFGAFILLHFSWRELGCDQAPFSFTNPGICCER
jgi:hypothetical protein